MAAALGEATAVVYGRNSNTVQIASLVSAIGAAVVGGSAEQVAIAAAAGGNAAENNYLNHDQWAQLKAGLDSCQKSGSDCKDVISAFRTLNKANDDYLAAVCQDSSSAACLSKVQEAVAAKDDQFTLGISNSVLGYDSQGRSN